MPDHCHFLILVDNTKGNISQIMHDWKSYTAKIILKDIRNQGAGKMPAPQRDVMPAPQEVVVSAVHWVAGKYAKSWVAGILPATIPSLWKKRFYTFPIFDEDKFIEKLNYIHNNPIRAGLVKNLEDYPWSSYQNYYLPPEADPPLVENNNSFISIDLGEN